MCSEVSPIMVRTSCELCKHKSTTLKLRQNDKMLCDSCAEKHLSQPVENTGGMLSSENRNELSDGQSTDQIQSLDSDKSTSTGVVMTTGK